MASCNLTITVRWDEAAKVVRELSVLIGEVVDRVPEWEQHEIEDVVLRIQDRLQYLVKVPGDA